MDFEQIEKTIEDHIDLIQITASGLAQGKERASKFLVVQAILSNYLRELEEGRAQLSTITDASYAQSIFSKTGKNITENKIAADADPEYTAQRENLEKLEAELNWIKTHMKIFENAHLMYRQYSRE